jgi:hypothetical protein
MKDHGGMVDILDLGYVRGRTVDATRGKCLHSSSCCSNTRSLMQGIVDRFLSEWLNGMAHGRGVETFPDGTIRHDGQWVEDEPVPN